MARRRRVARSNRISAIAGGVLLAIGCLWLGWLLIGQHAGGTPQFTFPGFAGPTVMPETQIPSLRAEGITLAQSDQAPVLGQQQALFLAKQLEPDAATKAKSITAKYVLLSYAGVGTQTVRPPLNNAPVWMIWYQQIPLLPADTRVDPTPFPHSYHDLFVFLDANNGKEMLSVWA